MVNDNISWELEKLILAEYGEIEAELFKRVIRDLASGKRVDAENWRIRKLRELATYRKGWERELQKLSQSHQKALENALKNSLVESSNLDDVVLSQAFGSIVKGTSTEAFTTRLQAAIRHAWSDLNMTNTQAIARAQAAFTEAVNSAYIRTLNGISTLDEAVRQVANDYAKQGMTVQYVTDSGKVINYNLADSVRRTLVTAINQTASEYSLSRAEEYGTDLVEVSAHAGARPEHAAWQGKVYSISGKTPGYRKLADATGYGSSGGLCGVNCRHTFWPYFAGYSKQNSHDDLPGLRENEELYNLQQKQRTYERTLRQKKREIYAAKETGDAARLPKLKNSLKNTRQEYLSFLDKNNLTRFNERENPHLPSK